MQPQHHPRGGTAHQRNAAVHAEAHRGGKDITVGTVAARTFRRAALGAYRHFGGTFKNLELPTWTLTDGADRISIAELRKLDSGAASVDEE
nr:hypothetical protein [Gammaproteobacteria bacterium]